MQGQNGEVHCGTGLTGLRRQWRIDRPAAPDTIATGRSADERRGQQQQEGRNKQPEADIVHPRERHIWRTDHQRYDPVAEAADHRRHDHEEDHDQAVRRYQHVEHVIVAAEDTVPRLGQFHTEDNRHGTTNDPRDNREDQVHRADVLVVGRINVAPPPRGMVVVMIVGCVCVSHI